MKTTTTTTDKVQVGDSTAGTSTSTTWRCPYSPSKAEQGWECPRCGRINAPWKSQCDCSRNNYWTITDGWIYKPYDDEWWKRVYCDSDTFKVHPETTTWKAPSSVCSSDSTTSVKSNPNSTIYTTARNPVVGGSDYEVNGTYVNVGGTQSNKVEPNVTAWSCTNPDIAVNDFTTYRTDIPKTYTTIANNINDLQKQIDELKETK